jgi:hypothetical protein
LAENLQLARPDANNEELENAAEATAGIQGEARVPAGGHPTSH